MRIALTVNGQARELEVAAGETLLDALRGAGYTGVKRGCEAGTCGSCVVLLDGTPSFSCMLFAATVEGRKVTTIEALGDPNQPHPIMQAFAEEAGVQCGYCVPGMVLTTQALLAEKPRPSEAEVKDALDGHLCRCTGYVKQVRAVLRASQLLAESQAGKKQEGGR
jgi:carbon-monoxide dehydrogenase small subunit